MFPSLRIKLTVALTLVTFLTVLLAALGMMLLLREREVSAARERVGQVSTAVEEQVVARARAGWKVDTLAEFLQQRGDELNVRFLLINSAGTILVDTGGRLNDQPGDIFLYGKRSMGHGPFRDFSFTTWEGQVVFVPARGAVTRFVTEDYRVVMLVPEANIAGAWKALLPRLALAAGIAVAVAFAVAAFISRSITRSVVVVTHAAEAMARGQYDQRIAVEGHDEIARMARTFNTMAQEVGRTHRAIRDLNGNVAHELKTPLTSIQGYSQAILDGVTRTPEEVQRAARVINEEAERMRQLVEDLLYLSRLESGQLRLEHAPIRVPRLLEHAAERVALRAKEGGRAIRLQMGIDIPVITGDERRLDQVLANLLDNALRHTEPGDTITLGARWSLDRVTITVHNTGSYIPPEHLPRIFERFYQADPARTRDGHHGGLGLAIAREIVAAHAGAIYAASDRESGTEFTIVLPTPLAAPAPAPRAGAVLTLPPPVAGSGSSAAGAGG